MHCSQLILMITFSTDIFNNTSDKVHNNYFAVK